MNKVRSLIILSIFSNLVFANELYRSKAGDSGKYYIVESKNLGNGIIQVLSNRIGKNNAYTDFTKLKVDCKNKKYFELAGSSENGAKSKPSQKLKDWSKNSKWVSLVPRSSKDDLVNYVCKKYR